MKRSTGNYIVLILSVSLLWLTLSFLVYRSLNHTDGNFIYATDDNYIFMAMAKNLSAQGNWSADAKSFSSSSSSHLWLLILSTAFLFFGTNELIPFVINVIAGTFLIYLLWRFFRSYSLSPVYALILMAAIILCTPLTSVILTGQEHTIQIILTISFVYYAASILSGENLSRQKISVLCVLALLLTATRYEGLFPVLIVSILFLLKKEFHKGAIVLFAGSLPVLIYGFISLSKGWYFFPNSIILKGQTPDFSSLYGIAKFLGLSSIEMMYYNPVILLLFLASLVFIPAGLKSGMIRHRSVIIMLIIFASMTLLHMQFARTGSYFRYEAYLVATGLFVTGISVSQIFGRKPFWELLKKSPIAVSFVVITTAVMMIPLFTRAKTSISITPTAIMNIYHQQYHMGLFLREFYNGKVIAANDIGAVNFLADLECVDLAGLGSLEVAEMMKNKSMTTEKIYELARTKDAKIAIVYDHWFDPIGGLPKSWIKIGNWTIQRNVNVAGSTVSFYAVDPAESEYLKRSLKTFSSHLPKSVKQTGEYTE